MIYLVIKEGVYRHDIFGAYSDSNEAARVAESLAKSDADDYHTYVVQPVPLDDPCQISETNCFVGHVAKEPQGGVGFRKE